MIMCYSGNGRWRMSILRVKQVKQVVRRVDGQAAELRVVVSVDSHDAVASASQRTLILEHVHEVLHLVAQGSSQLAPCP